MVGWGHEGGSRDGSRAFLKGGDKGLSPLSRVRIHGEGSHLQTQEAGLHQIQDVPEM